VDVRLGPDEPSQGRLSPTSDTPMILPELHRRATRLEWLTTLWNVIEAVVAIGSGAVAGSTALIAFGIDSTIEVSSAWVVLWRLLRVGPGASGEEHEHADRRAHFFVGITFFLLATYVCIEAGLGLIRAEAAHPSLVGILLACASLAAMPSLALAKQRTGREMGSKSLMADAQENWMCAYLSFSLLLGLGLNAWLGWWWADPMAGLAMVPLMVWQGRSAIVEARESDHD
jgi:divalent metal cation (Fe/Co/Zn/Cd) transporter